MNNKEMIIAIIILALSVQVTRALPFIIFRNEAKMPPVVGYLEKVLPAAIMGMLVVYCFKDYDYSSFRNVVPEVLSAAVVFGVHLWRKNMILSIVLGTTLYMVLIRVM